VEKIVEKSRASRVMPIGLEMELGCPGTEVIGSMGYFT